MMSTSLPPSKTFVFHGQSNRKLFFRSENQWTLLFLLNIFSSLLGSLNLWLLLLTHSIALVSSPFHHCPLSSKIINHCLLLDFFFLSNLATISQIIFPQVNTMFYHAFHIKFTMDLSKIRVICCCIKSYSKTQQLKTTMYA